MKRAGALLFIALATPTFSQSIAPKGTELSRAIDKELRPCPKAKGAGDIVVCRRAGETAALRYRLPIRDQGFDPGGPTDSVSRERHRMMDVGASGTGSCSASGAGGWTGCQSHQWKEARQQYGK